MMMISRDVGTVLPKGLWLETRDCLSDLQLSISMLMNTNAALNIVCAAYVIMVYDIAMIYFMSTGDITGY